MRLVRFLPLLALPAALFPALPAGAVPIQPQHHKALSEVRAPAREVVRVQVPAPDPRVLVRLGDTLWGIGTRTHRSWTALAAYNRILNPDLIYVGQVVRIPPASYVPPVAPPVAQPTVSPRVTETVSPRITQTTPRPIPEAQATAPAPAGGGGVWACIGQHESGNNAATNTGNGYYGAFQDTIGAWRAGGGGPGLPSDYSYSEQLRVNQNLQSQVGWGAWPNTSRMCGV